MSNSPILLHIATVPVTLWSFFGGQIRHMRRAGFEVQAVSSPGTTLDEFAQREGIAVHCVEMPRSITPRKDLVSLFRLYRILRRIRPTIVHAHTPKGGLLGMMAATLARVPVRVYHIHGLPYMTATGMRRRLLTITERISCVLAHRVLCVSRSVREVAVADGICPTSKITVILGGSINGVDANGQFCPTSISTIQRNAMRQQLGIGEGDVVLGFVGRVVRDKGLAELIAAWSSLREQFPAARLLVVGPFESQDPLPEEVECALRSDDRVHLTGERRDTSALLATMDLLVLPTYREGLPVVPLEAAAMELPVVATRIAGCVDAVEDGLTGTLVPPRDSGALAEAIRRYLVDPELRRKHGMAGRQRVLRDFGQEAIWAALYGEYCRLLAERGLAQPRGEY